MTCLADFHELTPDELTTEIEAMLKTLTPATTADFSPVVRTPAPVVAGTYAEESA